MTRHRRLPSLLATAAVAALLVTGCATPRAADGADAPDVNAPVGAVAPAPPAGEVVAQGTVLEAEDGPQLCLGAIALSLPPQCSGIPLAGWSWDEVEGDESSSGVTWGSYAVTGTFDGETFTVTQPPIMLALYDPMQLPDPTGGAEGTTSDSRLQQIQKELQDVLGDDFLMSYPERGYLWVDVVWDDGMLQEDVDTAYGDDVVIIRSALRPVGG